MAQQITDDAGSVWEITKDEKGREIAFRVGMSPNVRANTWPGRIIGHSINPKLIDQKGLRKGQKDIHNELFTRRCNAILFGPPGTGKTQVALHALRDLHIIGVYVTAVSYPQLVAQFRPTHLEETEETSYQVMERFASPQVLLIDDLGYADTGYQPKEHERMTLLELLKEREPEGRGTWITTNLTLSQLAVYGKAVIGRLREGNCIEESFENMPNFRLDNRTGSDN